MRKLLALVLAFVIAFSVSVVPVFAEDETETATTAVSVSSYDELKTALSNAADGESIILGDDIEITAQTDLKYSSTVASFYIDLNGHTLTFTPSSSTAAYALFVNYRWNLYVSNSSEASGGFVNNSDMDFFKVNGGSALYISDKIFSDVSCNAGIKFDDCTVNGSVSAGGTVEILAGKSLTVTGNLYCAGSLTMKDSASSLYVAGNTTIVKNATIYENSYFGGDVVISKDYSSSTVTTTVYGGIFKGAFSVAEGLNLTSSAKYTIIICGGSYYGKVVLGTLAENNLGTVVATIYDGKFYQNATITSDGLTIYRGSFSYTFLDENDNVLKTALVRLGSEIYPPTVPKKDKYTFTGWDGYTEGMTVSTVHTFKATYAQGEDSDTSKYEEVSTSVQYTAYGAAIEGAKAIYTDVAYPDINLSKTNGTETADTTNVYGVSEYIPATHGDIFRVSAIRTNIYESRVFAVAYDADKNFIGSLVHNEHTGLSFVGRRATRYSIGLLNDKTYHMDVQFQIPAYENGSLFENIAYIRVVAFKNASTTSGLQYLLAENDFYVAYMGNEAAEDITSGVNHLSDNSNDPSKTPLSTETGDLNGDGATDIADVLYMKKYLTKYDGYTVGLTNADLNFDGKINIKDLVHYRRYLVNYDGYELETPKFLALSFDDAPGSMSSVLDVFENYHSDNVRATYMLNGSRVKTTNYNLLLRAKTLGLDFGNHSTFHDWGIVFDSSGQYTASEIQKELNFTQDVIYEVTGQTNSYVRLPFFAVSGDIMREALSEMVIIEGTQSSDTSDGVTAEGSAATQLSQAADGNIVLLHDNGKLKATLEIMIPQLLEDGYVLCTVDELFQYCDVTPQAGYTYTNVYKGSKK